MTDKPTPTDAELKAMWQLHAADIGGIFDFARAVLAKWGQPAQAQADSVQEDAARYEKELEDALRERDEADDCIDTLLDEVLGADRAEWSSAYGRADALEEVRERITALHKPAVELAWKQFAAADSVREDAAQRKSHAD